MYSVFESLRNFDAAITTILSRTVWVYCNRRLTSILGCRPCRRQPPAGTRQCIPHFASDYRNKTSYHLREIKVRTPPIEGYLSNVTHPQVLLLISSERIALSILHQFLLP